MVLSQLSTAFAVCVFLFFLGAAARAQDLEALPTTPSSQALSKLVLLGSEQDLTRFLTPGAQAMKESVLIFERQKQGILRVVTLGRDVYAGEISKTGAKDFDLLNHKTNQTVTLDYSSVQEMEIPSIAPRPITPWARETVQQRIGEVIGIILMLPFRILEQLTVPQC